MPRVPTLDAPTVAPAQGIQNNFQPTLSAEAASLPGRQLQQQGQALEKAGGAFGDMYLKMAEEANLVRAKDAVNQAKKEQQRLMYDQTVGFTSIKGKDAVDRKSGKSLPDEYGEMFDTTLTQIGEGLSNPQQREMFAEAAATLSLNFRESTQRHFITEFTNYKTAVNKTEVETSLEVIRLNAGNSELIAAESKQVRDALKDQGKLTGAKDDAIEFEAQKILSPAHRANIGAMLDKKNYKGAEAYYKEHLNDIMSTDRKDIVAAIAEEQRLGLAIEIVDKTVASLAGGPAAVAELETESADPDGPPVPPRPRLTSRNASYKELKAFVPNLGRGFRPTSDYRGPKHPLTIANPNSAHAKAEAIDLVAPSNEVGRDPAAFNRAVEMYRRAGFSIKAKNEYLDPAKWATGGHWHIELVADDGENLPARPSKMDASYRVTEQEFRERALKLAGPDIDPRMRLAIEERASNVWRLEDSAFKQRQDENLLGVYRYLVNNGGDVTTLPRSALMNISADKIPAIQQFAKSISDNNRDLNPNKDVLYFDLTNNPKGLRDMTASEFFAIQYQMPAPMWQSLNNQRIALIDARDNPDPTKTKVNDIPTADITRSLNQKLDAMGIPSSPPAKDLEGKARVGAIRSMIDKAVAIKQKEIGRQLYFDETDDFIDSLLSRSYTTENMNAFGQRTGKYTSTPLPKVKYGDIPKTRQDRIKAYLKSRNGKGAIEPSEYEVFLQFILEESNVLPQATPKR